jgi:hypothetical protein
MAGDASALRSSFHGMTTDLEGVAEVCNDTRNDKDRSQSGVFVILSADDTHEENADAGTRESKESHATTADLLDKERITANSKQ